jgi:hypothetical protein
LKKHYVNVFSNKKHFKNNSSVHVFAHAKDFFAFILLYNGYDYLIEKNLLESIEVIIVIHDNFYLEIY